MISRIYHWLSRIRRRRGYGIHSPYAFGFVTDVVYNDSAYYAYSRLAQDDAHIHPLRRPSKDYRLIFRLTNFFRPIEIVSFLKDADVEHRYIQSACPEVQIRRNAEPCTTSLSRPLIFVTADVLTADARRVLHQLIDGDGVSTMPFAVCCLDINLAEGWWTQLKERIRRQGIITIDLYRIGIILSEQHLKRQDYKIAYL